MQTRPQALPPLHPSSIPSMSALPSLSSVGMSSPRTATSSASSPANSIASPKGHSRSRSDGAAIMTRDRSGSISSRSGAPPPPPAPKMPTAKDLAIPGKTKRMAMRPKTAAEEEEAELQRSMGSSSSTASLRRQSVAAIADAATAAAAADLEHRKTNLKPYGSSGTGLTAPTADDDTVSTADMRTPLRRFLDESQRSVLEFLDWWPIISVMVFATGWALFIADVRTISIEKSGDAAVNMVTTIVFFLFIAEIALQSFSSPKYFMNFFFWLDIVALLSLLPDVPILYGTSAAPATASAEVAATRLGRIFRFVRLIRLIRVFTQCNDCCGEDEDEIRRRRRQTRRLKASRVEGPNVLDHQADEDEDDEEAAAAAAAAEKPLSSSIDGGAVGQRLSDLTMQRVVTGVLLLAILVPSLELTEINDAAQYNAMFVHTNTVQLNAANASTMTSAIYEASIQFLFHNVPNAMYLRVNTTDIRLNNAAAIAALRPVELSTLLLSSSNVTTELWVSLRDDVVANAKASVGMVCFLIALLCGGAIFFNKDAQELVIVPIERMVAFVRRLSSNPLAKIQKHEDDEDEDEDEEGADGKPTQQFETVLLENTLRKLGGLLQIGFGDAGAEIIGQNMKGDFLDPMVSGKRLQAIFGFCDIRQFTDTTECLQEKIMTYVNQVAEVVHGATHRQGGAANKNIGDAFLLVWKFPQAKRIAAARRVRALEKAIEATGFQRVIQKVRQFVRGDTGDDEASRAKRAEAEAAAATKKAAAEAAKAAKAKPVAGLLGNKVMKNQSRGFNTGMRQERTASVGGDEDGGDLEMQAGGGGGGARGHSGSTPVSARRGSNVSSVSDSDPNFAAAMAAMGLRDPDAPKPEQTKVAERALIALLQMLIEIAINTKLNPWRKNADILARMPDFDIKLGFGLHMGWAVEGALGSEQKIDASYLGSQVNLSMFLEEHTKEYGVPLLMSGELYDLLSPTVQVRCRWLDSLTVTGRDEPLDIFTFDFTTEGVALAKTRAMLNAGGLAAGVGAGASAASKRGGSMMMRGSSSSGGGLPVATAAGSGGSKGDVKIKVDKARKPIAGGSGSGSRMRPSGSSGDGDVIDLMSSSSKSKPAAAASSASASASHFTFSSAALPPASSSTSASLATISESDAALVVSTPTLSVTVTPVDAPPKARPTPVVSSSAAASSAPASSAAASGAAPLGDDASSDTSSSSSSATFISVAPDVFSASSSSSSSSGDSRETGSSAGSGTNPFFTVPSAAASPAIDAFVAERKPLHLRVESTSSVSGVVGAAAGSATNSQLASASASARSPLLSARAAAATLSTPRSPFAAAEKRTFYILESLKGGETDDLAPLQTGLDPNFVPTYNEAIKCYVGGKWQDAKMFLDMCLELKDKDKAALNLLEFMESHHFQAPANWKGYREEGGGGH